MNLMRMIGCVCGTIVICTVDVNGAIRVKANNTNDLYLSSSWVGATLPYSGDIAQWDATVTSANAVQLGGNMSVRGISIVNPGGAVAIGGSHMLTVGGEGVVTRSTVGDLIFSNANFSLLMYAGQIWDGVVGSTVRINPGTFTRNPGSTIGFNNAGVVTSSVLTNDSSGLVGTWARTGAGTATRYATVNAGSIVPYTAAVAAAIAGDIVDTTGVVNYDLAAVGVFGAGVSANTVRYTGASGTLSGTVGVNGLMNVGSGALTLSGTTTIGNAKELVVTSPDSTRKVAFSGVIADNSAGSSGVTITGGGQVDMTANNTYNGQTVVGAGRLYITKPNALGSTNGNTVIHVIGSSVTGGILHVSGNITVPEPLMFVGPGDGAPWSQAFYSNGGTNTLTGPITIATAGGVRFTAGGAGTGLIINGPITRTTSGSSLILGGGGVGGLVAINCPISNNYGSVNLHSGPGTILFNVANNAIGDMNVQYKHILKLGISGALNSGSTLAVGNSNTQTGEAAQGTFDLNGFSQVVNGFYGDGEGVTAPATTRVVTNSAAGLSVFTIGNANSGGTFNGYIIGNIALVKNGTGTEVLCGPNRYTGGTTLNGGILVLSNAVNHGALTVNGGTFRFAPSLSVTGSLSGAGGTIDTLATGSTLTIYQASNTLFSGAITNAGAFVKNGLGTLTLAGVNTFSGGITVNEGGLVFARTNALPSTGNIVLAEGANIGFGVGGTGCFTQADIDALWANTYPRVTLNGTSLVVLDTSAGDFTQTTAQSTRGLIKTGVNTLRIAGVNTYSGGTLIQQGVLSIAATSALPGWNTTGSYEVYRDAALAVQNTISDTDLTTLLGSGNFADGACFGFDTYGSNRTCSLSFANTARGALGLYKVGTNILYLSGTSTYDGNTTLNGGILSLSNADALGSTNGYTTINRVGGTSPLYTDSTGQLQLNANNGPLVWNENFYLTGAEQYGYTGALRNNVGTNILNGWIRIFGASARIGVTAGNLILNGPIERIDAATNPMLVLNPNAGMLIVSNSINLGTGGMNFHSGGTVWLCATGSVWSGYQQVQYGCIVRLGVDHALPTGVKLTLGNTGTPPGNGTFDLYGFDQTLAGLAQYGTDASYPNNIIRNTQANDPSTLTITQAAGVNDLFSGRIIERINLVMAGTPTSTLTLAASNTLSGSVVVNGGTLAIGASGSLGPNCTNITVTAGTLSVQNSAGAALADTATIYMSGSGSAKIAVTNGVTETVRFLIVDGKYKRAGTYGSSDSPAANRDSTLFSGMGVLNVRSDISGTSILVR